MEAELFPPGIHRNSWWIALRFIHPTLKIEIAVVAGPRMPQWSKWNRIVDPFTLDGDHRDWNAIRAWAEQVADDLVPGSVPR